MKNCVSTITKKKLYKTKKHQTSYAPPNKSCEKKNRQPQQQQKIIHFSWKISMFPSTHLIFPQ